MGPQDFLSISPYAWDPRIPIAFPLTHGGGHFFFSFYEQEGGSGGEGLAGQNPEAPPAPPLEKIKNSTGSDLSAPKVTFGHQKSLFTPKVTFSLQKSLFAISTSRKGQILQAL